MVDLGVRKRTTEPTPFVSPMVIAKDKGKLHACIDLTDVKKFAEASHPIKNNRINKTSCH